MHELAQRAIEDAGRKQLRAYDACAHGRHFGVASVCGFTAHQEKGPVNKTDVALGGAVHGVGTPDGGSLPCVIGGMSLGGSATPGPIGTLPTARIGQAELVGTGRGTEQSASTCFPTPEPVVILPSVKLAKVKYFTNMVDLHIGNSKVLFRIY